MMMMNDEMMSQIWVFDFYETFICYGGCINLNFYISKKVQKNFLMGFKIWSIFSLFLAAQPPTGRRSRPAGGAAARPAGRRSRSDLLLAGRRFARYEGTTPPS